MNLEEYREDIEAIKMAASVSSRLGVEREKTLILGIRHIMEFYENDSKEEYLLGALLQIQAYLELGLTYRANQELFETVLKKAGLEKDEVFPRRFYVAKQVKLNKSQVRGMLRKWSTSQKNGMHVQQVVQDIIDKVKKREQGVFYYHNHTSPSGVDDDLYELVIKDEECYFHDMKLERYYEFYEYNKK